MITDPAQKIHVKGMAHVKSMMELSPVSALHTGQGIDVKGLWMLVESR